MKLSTKCRYGVRAIIEIARNYNKIPTKRKDISSNQDIPDSYLENILIDLKHNNVISSIRGAKGGFVLRKPPEKITMLEVFESLQGTISLIDCIDTPSACNRNKRCVVRPVWEDMQKAQERVLQNITIKSLLEKERELEVIDFNI